MKKLNFLILFLLPAFLLHGSETIRTLFDFSIMNAGISKMENCGWEIRNGRLRMNIPEGAPRWTGLRLTDPSGKGFNVNGGSVIAFEVHNPSDRFSGELQVELICTHPDRQWRYRSKGGTALRGKETFTCRIPFRRDRGGIQNDLLLNDTMKIPPNGVPGKSESQRSHLDIIDEIRIFTNAGGWQGKEQIFEISNIRLEKPVSPPGIILSDPKKFFPCIDRFGQYIHFDSRNIRSDAELSESGGLERESMQNRRKRNERDRFGGLANGPSFPVTGHFYPVKYNGKWFLADPEGKLFWGFGVQGVRWTDATPITFRKHWFAELPSKDDPLFGICYGKQYSQAPWYKKNKGHLETFNFHMRNLISKYGTNWKEAFAESAVMRLRDWNMNLIGVNSSSLLTEKARIPYILNPAGARPKLRNGKSFFFDVFDPLYSKKLEKNLIKMYAASFNDPFCIGFCIDNELFWGKPESIGSETVASPAGQWAKRKFLNVLKEKYRGNLDSLNNAWGMDFKTWKDFLTGKKLPVTPQGLRDLEEFSDLSIETYFKLNRAILKKHAPNKLYLGSRMHDYPEKALISGAQYLDVISMNLYRHSVADLSLPENIDKPVIVTEYHFGLMDGGLPAGGIQSCASPEDRKHAFVRYVESALSNPLIIGVVWFQYLNQSPIGRHRDGENFRCGFIDVADRPEPDLAEGAREIGSFIYRFRLNGLPQ